MGGTPTHYEILEGDIGRLADRLPEEARYVIGANRTTLRLALQDFTAIRDHYKAEDAAGRSRPEDASLQRLVQAESAAAWNEHREALPLYWTDLLDAYEDGIWARLRAAHQRFARECWAVGWFAESAFHAVASLHKETVTLIATQALASQNSAVIAETLRPVLHMSNLLEHRAMGAVILETLYDVIPEEVLDEVLNWIERGIDHPVETAYVAEKISSLWRAIAVIAPRLSPQKAETMTAKALNHPCYTKFILQRRYVIDALNGLFAKLNTETMARVAESCSGLLGSQKHDTDFSSALNLALTIAQKSAPLRHPATRRLRPPT